LSFGVTNKSASHWHNKDSTFESPTDSGGWAPGKRRKKEDKDKGRGEKAKV